MNLKKLNLIKLKRHQTGALNNYLDEVFYSKTNFLVTNASSE